jgi:tRNA A-37 threonylcarbamoyl transferase component Bud32
MLTCCQSEAISPFVFPVVKDSYRSGEIKGVAYAGYLLAQVGQKQPRPDTEELKRELAVSLFGLHSHNVIHGDPRVENALTLDGHIKWIDFRTAHFVTAKVSRRRDVEILYSSVGGTSDVRAEIELYANDPTVDLLVNVLLM